MRVEVKKVNNILLQGSDFIYNTEIDKQIKKGQVFVHVIEDEHYFYYNKEQSITITDKLYRITLNSIRGTYPIRENMILISVNYKILSYDDFEKFMSEFYKNYIRKQKIKRLL
jgi:hypothetical protein